MNDQCYYRVSVKAIVIEDDKILLCREDNGRWDMMGGGLDHDEAPIDGLRREIHEETGLIATHVSPSPIYFLTVARENTSSSYYMANVIYEVKLKNLDFTPSEECQELKFFAIEDMKDLDVYPNVRKLMEIFGRN